jgi:uncharacterized protein (DUF4415 family)
MKEKISVWHKGSRRKDRTDWEAVARLTDEDIARAVASDPDTSFADAAFWKKARWVMPVVKKPVTLRLDSDVLEFFRRGGKGYQTRINAVLRAFMQSNRTASAQPRRAAEKRRRWKAKP